MGEERIQLEWGLAQMLLYPDGLAGFSLDLNNPVTVFVSIYNFSLQAAGMKNFLKHMRTWNKVGLVLRGCKDMIPLDLSNVVDFHVYDSHLDPETIAKSLKGCTMRYIRLDDNTFPCDSIARVIANGQTKVTSIYIDNQPLSGNECAAMVTKLEEVSIRNTGLSPLDIQNVCRAMENSRVSDFDISEQGMDESCIEALSKIIPKLRYLAISKIKWNILSLAPSVKVAHRLQWLSLVGEGITEPSEFIKQIGFPVSLDSLLIYNTIELWDTAPFTNSLHSPKARVMTAIMSVTIPRLGKGSGLARIPKELLQLVGTSLW